MSIDIQRVHATVLDERWSITVHAGEAKLAHMATTRAGLSGPVLNEQLGGATGEAVRLMLAAHGGVAP